MFTALLALFLPLFAGLVVGRTQMFESKDALIVLTRFALVVAFPALIIASWIDPRQGIDIAPWALVLVFVGPLIGTLAALALGGKHRGAVALVALFGNSSFLGLPCANSRDEKLTTSSAFRIGPAPSTLDPRAECSRRPA